MGTRNNGKSSGVAFSIRRRRAGNSASSNSCSLSLVIVYGIVCSMFFYILAMVSLTKSLTSKPPPAPLIPRPPIRGIPEPVVKVPAPAVPATPEKRPEPVQAPPTEPKKEVPPPAEKKKAPPKDRKDWGYGVEPQLLRTGTTQSNNDNPQSDTEKEKGDDPQRRILTAYLEPIDRVAYKRTPLPNRTTASADALTAVPFPRVDSCKRLPEQWPVDEYPEEDPFLPWIHDVFPTHDGRFVQFIAQNRRRCRTGTTDEELAAAQHTEPQVALFQHVAVKRVNATDGRGGAPRYRLSSHADADPDGLETRFVCRFQPSGEETLSVYNFNYEWASFRKRIKQMFHEEGRDNKQIHTSQLVFKCPVPESLVETVRTGASVEGDRPTLFVDLVPIRTPPRYGSPQAFLPPYYDEFQAKGADAFDADTKYGRDHLLPRVEDSGRWANIPICKPSLLTYGHQADDSEALAEPPPSDQSTGVVEPVKQHHLVSCLWASTGYATRGNRFAINDGQRRLLEWITYNKLIGIDHFYLYDNSGAFGKEDPLNSLHFIKDLFPDEITIIDWPSRVCNNNPNNVDSVGERSSQYAAEASCRLRFGPHVKWIAQFDIDEYLVPMGNHSSILPLLDKLDEEGNKIVSFGSWRAWPRRRFIETPERLHGQAYCGRNQDCFQLRIPLNYTMLQSYNCDRQKPGEKVHQMPAEKQIYRPEYVLHHFIHYSTVTAMSALNKKDILAMGRSWVGGSAFPDPLSRFGDEVSEGLMLHTKAVATQDTVFWETACKAEYDGKQTCRLGTPFPDNQEGVDLAKGDEGWKFNCYVNHKIDDYWVPRLENNLKNHIPELARRLELKAASSATP